MSIKQEKYTNITISMNIEQKKQAEKLFRELGMNMTTAFNIFIRQSLRENRIPFMVNYYIISAHTIEKVLESEQYNRDPDITAQEELRQLMQEVKKKKKKARPF